MHDLVALGEVMLRLSIPAPARFETIRQLDVQIGGAEANVAAACARLGLRAAWLSALPANPWGERIRRELTAHGVDCGQVRMLADARVGVYFLEFGTPPRPIRVLYDRRDSAFARLTPEAIDWQTVRQARCVHLQEGAWTANTGNGHFGGMQFMAQTWKRLGGAPDPAFNHPGNSAYPFRASKTEQLYRAWLLWKHDGGSWRSWGAIGEA